MGEDGEVGGSDEQPTTTRGSTPLPTWLTVGSEVSWRLIVIGAAVALLASAAAYVSFVVVPVIVATFVCAILDPIRARLHRHGLSASRSSLVALLVGLLLISGVILLVVEQTVSNFDELSTQFQGGLDRLTNSLAGAPFHIRADRLQRSIEGAYDRFKENPGKALSGAFSVLSTTGGLVAGGLLALITVIFLMTDRERIFRGVVSAAPVALRGRVERSGHAAWDVLVAYVQVTLTSAVVDSLAIGGAAAIAGLPIAVALGAIVFLMAFIPTLGAVVSGALVVMVAFVTKGTTTAIVLAIVVLAVQQLDANVMYPMLTRRRLQMHPLLSLLLVAIGGVVGGIFGAFIAVPLAAMAAAALRAGDPATVA